MSPEFPRAHADIAGMRYSKFMSVPWQVYVVANFDGVLNIWYFWG